MRPQLARTSLAASVLLAGSLGATRPATAQSASACAAVAGNLVANCGFETGSFSGWTLGGDTSNSGVDMFSSHTGRYGAYFANNGAPQTVAQTLATTAGTRYTYRFWLLSEDLTYQGPAFFRALVGGQPLFDLEGQATGSFTAYSFSAVATGASTPLQFVVENAPSFYQLDDVSVAPSATITPEPASAALVGGGLLALGAAARRRRARA